MKTGIHGQTFVSLVSVLVVANAIGAAYGFIFYYGQQLSETPIWLWPFVPDCPLYSLLIAVSLVLIVWGIKSNWFIFISLIGAMKYGFWTVYVLGAYSAFYFTPESSFMYFVLFVAHIFLFLEAFLLLGNFRPDLKLLWLALGWFLLNDLSDYVLNTHPPIPAQYMPQIFAATVVMSVFFSLFAFFLARRAKKPVLARLTGLLARA